MNAPLTMSQPNGPEALVHALIETLNDERDALVALGTAFQDQLDHVRTSPAAVTEEATHTASEIVARLGRLRTARERQTRLLRRVLRMPDDDLRFSTLEDTLVAHATLHVYGAVVRETRAAVRQAAGHTRRVCEELNFALHYAAELGRELLQGIHDQVAPAGPKTYDAAGRTARAASRSMLNQVG